jgi:hypothetical protein
MWTPSVVPVEEVSETPGLVKPVGGRASVPLQPASTPRRLDLRPTWSTDLGVIIGAQQIRCTACTSPASSMR